MKRFFLFTAVLLLTAGTASAAVQPGMSDDSASIMIGNDFYIAGGDVDVSREVADDLIVAGGNVRIGAIVRGDILAAGGDVMISKSTAEDVRVMGGTVTVDNGTIVYGDVIVTGGTFVLAGESIIRGNLVAMGGSIKLSEGTRVQGKLHAAGGKVVVAGVVEGPAEIESGHATLSGMIGGASRIVADTILLEPQARLGGDLEYWTKDGPMDFRSAVVGGSGTAAYNASLGARRHDAEKGAEAAAAAITAFTVLWFLSGVIVMVVLWLLMPKLLVQAGQYGRKNPWMSMLWGFLYFAAMPVLIVLLMLTVLGVPLALFLLFLFIFTWLFATPLTAIVLATLSEHHYGKKLHWGVLLLLAIGFFIALKALWFIPIVGWIVRILLHFFGVGALLAAIWYRRKKSA